MFVNYPHNCRKLNYFKGVTERAIFLLALQL